MTATPPHSARWWLRLALGATLLFRFWLAAAAPVTADEAYFILWGREPALGYYDHPPMVGWWLAPLAAISDAPWLLRLPAVLVPPLAALGVAAAVDRWFGRDRDTAALAALAVLLVPMNLWNVLITTDTPLVLFSVGSLLVFARAAQRDSAALYLASGALLGLAFLSKYFAVLLGVGYLAWAVVSRKPRAFLLVFAGGLPAGLLNLYWNVEHCWSNVMFNAINRHDEDGGWSARTPLLYAASLAYLAAPLLWFAWRGRDRLRAAWVDPAQRALMVAWLAPLAVFALLSPVKRIGLHWLLSFMPALVLTVALALERRALLRTVQVFGVLTALQVLAIVTATALPESAWKSFAGRLVFPGRITELLAAAPAPAGAVLASDSYAAGALLAYHARRSVPVFGVGTSHARHDDIRTDWRSLAGRDFVILRREVPAGNEYAPYFREVEVRRLPLKVGAFHAVVGRGFDYEAYRKGVLTRVGERFYRIPAWLPRGACYFTDRYLPR